MSDWMILGSVFAVVAAGFAGFLLYAIYGGSRTSLASAKVGEVFNFTYRQPLQGDPERFLAKVLDVHTLDDASIRRLNARSRYRANDPQFVRTRHLVTCAMPNGSVRNFYAERTANCRKPILAGTLFKSPRVASLFC